MKIDGLALIYQTAQRCRHTLPTGGITLPLPAAAAYLMALEAALPVIQRERRMVVDLPRSLVLPLVRHGAPQPPLRPWWQWITHAHRLDVRAQPFLDLLVDATAEAQQHWTNQDTVALRALGYALHNLPDFLREPESFQPEAYRHSLIGVYLHSQPTAALERHFAQLLGCAPDAVRALVEQR